MVFSNLEKLRKQDYSLRRVVCHMQYWRKGSNWIIQEGGRHNTAVLALLGIGADYLDADTHELIASACPGDLVLIPQGIRYEFIVRNALDTIANIANLPNGCYFWDGVKRTDAEKGQKANAVFLGFEMLDDNGMPATFGANIEVLRFKEAHEIFRQLEQIARDVNKVDVPLAIIKAKTFEFLTYLSDLQISKNPLGSAYKRIEPSLQHIAGGEMGTLTVKDLADRCAMSPSRFRTLFKQEMGMPPQEYIQNKKLQAAIGMLTGSDMQISDIAVESGFRDAFYFSRIFRKLTGMSPSQWRKTNR